MEIRTEHAGESNDPCPWICEVHDKGREVYWNGWWATAKEAQADAEQWLVGQSRMSASL